MSLKSLAAAAACLCFSLPALAVEPADLVESFYLPEVVSGMEPEVRERFTEPATNIFAMNDEVAESGDGACIDFALSIDGQDYDQDEIARTLRLEEDVSGDDATVSATFNQFAGQADSGRLIIWTLRNIDGEWKIANISSDTSDWILTDFTCE